VSFSEPFVSVGLGRKMLRQFDEKLGNKLGKVMSFDGMILFLLYILEKDVSKYTWHFLCLI